MGLDIVCYGNLVKKTPETENKESKVIDVKDNKDFPGRLVPFTEGKWQGEELFYFRAGSYGSYNEWRRKLSKATLDMDPEEIWKDYDKFKGWPFVELIAFSDCEGTLGTDVSAKLFEDFKDHQEIISESFDDSDDTFVKLYNNWMIAFEFAAKNNGVVHFC